MNYIQYDDISQLLGWSARLRWRVSPGNEIYLVYNKNWERRWDPVEPLHPPEERGVFKISLSIRPMKDVPRDESPASACTNPPSPPFSKVAATTPPSP